MGVEVEERDDDEIGERLLAISLRTLVEELPFDVWIRDADDKMIFANAALRRRWGTGILGRTVTSSEVDPTVAERWKTTNRRALAGETVKDEVVYALDGGTRTVIGVVAPIRDETGIRGTVGINVDVTGERQARAEAHRVGQLLRDIFTSAPVAMGVRAVQEDDLVHIEDNPCAAALLGSTPDALRGKSERELGIAPEETARTLARFREAREARGPVPIELSYTENDGYLRAFAGKAIAIEHPNEERYAFIAADVSELRRLQTGLIRADRLASLGTLSASIGHEIGTSAAIALGQLEISMKLVESSGPREEVLVGLQEAQRALLRAVGVLRDMRALAIGATLGSETCDVGVAIETVKDVLRRELERNVTLHEVREAGIEVAISHSRIVQILLNLIRNAIEAAGVGGAIWLEVTRLSPERVRIDVADDGPGFPTALREKLFQPFVSTKAEGTGLGLYVCGLLATSSGGKIEALAREGGGVCIRLELPAAT
jgi:PAS domain S-box-containing protein